MTSNGFEERWQEIRGIHKKNHHIYGISLGLILIAIVTLIGWHVFTRNLDDYHINLWTGLLDFGLTVLVIDRLNELRAQRQLKADLIYKMASTIRPEAVRAVEELRRFGWLSDGSLRGAWLWYADLQNADLTWHPNPDLREVDLNGANLQEVSLSHANLEGAQLSHTNLRSAALDGVNLQHARVYSAYMEGTNLRGAILRHIGIAHTAFTSADLTKSDMSRGYLHQCDLSEVKLCHAKLNNVSLAATDLRKADFDGAELHGADFYEANLEGANILDEQLKQAGRLWGATMPDGSRYDGHFNLVGDVEWAKANGVDTANSDAMKNWYKNGPQYPRGFKSVRDEMNNVSWGRKNLPKLSSKR